MLGPAIPVAQLCLPGPIDNRPWSPATTLSQLSMRSRCIRLLGRRFEHPSYSVAGQVKPCPPHGPVVMVVEVFVVYCWV
jgi:hypothetical protein